jgi:hypothetical protein
MEDSAKPLDMDDVCMEALADVAKKRSEALTYVAKKRTQGLADVTRERTNALADVAKERTQGLADVTRERVEGFAILAKERAEGLAMLARKCTEGLAEVTRERAEGLAVLAEVRAEGLADVMKERTKAFAEIAEKWADLHHEIHTMRKHKESHEGRITLYIGGYRFDTSVQTLRRVPDTFFYAYFSGRYAQDVCADGSIFVDRDGMHFGHVLEYLRDGSMSVAEAGANASVSLLRALKREFNFYCIPLRMERNPNSELVFVVGGRGTSGWLSSVERYDPEANQWTSLSETVGTGHDFFGICALMGEIYVTGGRDCEQRPVASVEKFSPNKDGGTWSTTAPLPFPRLNHIAITVDSAMYVFGGLDTAPARPHVYRSTRSVLRYDSKKWRKLAPLPPGLGSFNVAAVLSSNIFVFGNERDAIGHIFKYETGSNTWCTVLLEATPKHYHYENAVALNGSIYLVGQRFNEEIGFTLFTSFDVVTRHFKDLAPPTEICCRLFLVDGCLYAAGGWKYSSRVQRYNVYADVWSEVACMGEGRRGFAHVTIPAVGVIEDANLFDALSARLL